MGALEHYIWMYSNSSLWENHIQKRHPVHPSSRNNSFKFHVFYTYREYNPMSPPFISRFLAWFYNIPFRFTICDDFVHPRSTIFPSRAPFLAQSTSCCSLRDTNSPLEIFQASGHGPHGPWRQCHIGYMFWDTLWDGQQYEKFLTHRIY